MISEAEKHVVINDFKTSPHTVKMRVFSLSRENAITDLHVIGIKSKLVTCDDLIKFFEKNQTTGFSVINKNVTFFRTFWGEVQKMSELLLITAKRVAGFSSNFHKSWQLIIS